MLKNKLSKVVISLMSICILGATASQALASYEGRHHSYRSRPKNTLISYQSKTGTSTSQVKPLPISTTTPIVITSSSTPVIATSTIGAYGLNQNIVLQEEGSPAESASPYWWLNSGAYFTVNNGVGMTQQGKLATNDPWRSYYNDDDPEDTSNGYYPQNIFRLVTKSTWQNYTQQAYFTVNAYNANNSSNRAGDNGFLFFNHYVDSQNLYYTGLRVDGTAVIKKKINSNYYTMAQVTVFPGTYNRTSNPNLLPLHTPIGLRSDVQDNADGSVTVKLYVDKNQSGNWILVAQVTDNGTKYGGKPITQKAPAGIRTDFMDAQFTGYSLIAH